jgi:hypothetical protein
MGKQITLFAISPAIDKFSFFSDFNPLYVENSLING